MEVQFAFKGVGLVTGGGSGIGRAIAIELAKAGAQVVLVDMDQRGMEETAEQIAVLGGVADTVCANVADPEQMERAARAAAGLPGGLRYAVNAAGIANASPVLDMSVEQWDKMYEVDAKGVFVSSQAELRAMTDGGSIVNIASMSGSIVNRGLLQVHYNSAKAAVMHFSKSLAMEAIDMGVRVNSLSPGYTATPMNTRPEVADQAAKFAADTPIGRMGEPNEIAYPALFLLSDGAAFVTGIDMLVDGGFCCW